MVFWLPEELEFLSDELTYQFPIELLTQNSDVVEDQLVMFYDLGFIKKGHEDIWHKYATSIFRPTFLW